ncbi:MAG: nucleoside triphosphate pyrophosphohydrolase [Marinicaulis sp.]|nr:nucleoside triphosphate pyrophosphohydrolase [Marinicaulis sp.]NNL89989.1 nucleoside triphosphate pyrophosphohydrolase [Marinicaulis sp.]
MKRNQEQKLPNYLNHDHARIDALLELMARLRNPVSGCPWDLDQDFKSVAPHTIEEAYEVADAIERGEYDELKSELGDLLFQVVFHSQIATEQKLFSFGDVVRSVTEKMIDRHPHVFADDNAFNKETHHQIWETRKSDERKASGHTSLMDDIPVALPAVSRSVKIQKRAATIGFDWTELKDVCGKISEEIDELHTAVNGDQIDEIEDEIGDALFAIINLARHKRLDPERALRRTNDKFMRRFRYIEQQLTARNEDLSKTSLEEMEELWQDAKQLEREA